MYPYLIWQFDKTSNNFDRNKKKVEEKSKILMTLHKKLIYFRHEKKKNSFRHTLHISINYTRKFFFLISIRKICPIFCISICKQKDNWSGKAREFYFDSINSLNKFAEFIHFEKHIDKKTIKKSKKRTKFTRNYA